MTESVDEAFNTRIGLIIMRGIVSLSPKLFDLVGKHTEKENVAVADFLMDFDVRTVERADGERAVDHKLHIARAACFFACERNLLADFCCRHDDFGKGYAVVFKEHDFESALDVRIVVDEIAQRTDKADDLLCHIVCACRFCAENERARLDIEIGIIFDLQIQIEDIESVEKLTLVLVQSLHLHVEDAVGVDLDVVVFEDILCKVLLVLTLDVGKAVENLSVAHISLQVLQFV